MNQYLNMPLPRVYGVVNYSQDGREQTISCICKFTDGTEKKIVAFSARQLRMKILAELADVYVNDSVSLFKGLYSLGEYKSSIIELDAPTPSVELSKYIVSEYMDRYITKRGDTTLSKIAEYTRISSKTIYKIWNGEVEYKRNKMLRIGVALNLPNADLTRFMNAAGFYFPLNKDEHKIETLHIKGIWNYNELRSEIGGNLL